jgi:hypothetical protein
MGRATTPRPATGDHQISLLRMDWNVTEMSEGPLARSSTSPARQRRRQTT